MLCGLGRVGHEICSSQPFEAVWVSAIVDLQWHNFELCYVSDLIFYLRYAAGSYCGDLVIRWAGAVYAIYST